MAMIAHPHIRLDARGVAWIDDANVKVIEVVLDRLAYGWSPEEIHFQHPHLRLPRSMPPSRSTTTTSRRLTPRSPTTSSTLASSDARPRSRRSCLG